MYNYEEYPTKQTINRGFYYHGACCRFDMRVERNYEKRDRARFIRSSRNKKLKTLRLHRDG